MRKVLHVAEFACPVAVIINEGCTDQVGNTDSYCDHFIEVIESVGCAGSYCYDGDDPEQSTAYQWVIEPYDWYKESPEIQHQKLLEAIQVIKDHPYPNTKFTRYQIVDGFWPRIFVDWTEFC